MNDRKLLEALKGNPSVAEKKELEEELWERYQNLVHKNWNILRKQMNNSSQIWAAQDDYYSDAYIAMKKCIKAIDLNKIENDKWKFVGYYRFYLKNVRSKIIKDISRLARTEKSMVLETDSHGEISLADIAMAHNDNFTVYDDPADLLVKKESQDHCDNAVDVCKKSWNEVRNKIYRLREEGVNKRAIATELGVHPATITYYMRGMKKDIEEALGLN